MERTSDTDMGDKLEDVHPRPSADRLAGVRYDREWLTSLFRPLLITLLVTCINIALLAFIRNFLTLTVGYARLIVMLGIFAAIIGCVTTTYLAQPAERGRRNSHYRTAEIALLLILARLLVWGVVGNLPAATSLFTRPLDNLLESYYVGAAIVTLISWLLASDMTAGLQSMALQPDELYMLDNAGDHRRESARVIQSDRGQVLSGFVARWVAGGILLVIFAAGSQMDLAQNGLFAILRQKIDPLVIGAVIVYFPIGLILISQGHLAMLRARWALEDTPSRNSVLQNWSVYALLYVVLIGIVAALLPFGGTFRLAQIVSWIVRSVYFVAFGIMQLLSFAILYLLSLFISGEEAPEAPPPAQAPPIPPPVEEVAGTGIDWLGGLAFWLIALALIAYAASVYFNDRGITLQWLRQFWQALRMRLRLLAHNIHRPEADPEQDGEKSVAGDSVLARISRLIRSRKFSDPGQQLRYYYLSLLQSAEHAGVRRRHSETPYEYAPRLADSLPEEDGSAESFHDLTEVFIDSRYANKTPNQATADGWEKNWKRLRKQITSG